MMLYRTLLALFLLSAAGSTLAAQDTTGVWQSGRWFRKSSLIVIPILYYTPETRLAGGAAGLFTFFAQGQSDAQRRSQLQLGAAYTQERQLLLYFPFQVFFGGDAWQVAGELGYYRYVYRFFGIGNETRVEDEEFYDVHFPRVRLNLLKRLAPRHYLGLRYWWDDYRIVRTEEGGLLDTGEITGSDGGVLSGAGLLWNVDSRDQIFYPTRGFWSETELFINHRVLGSDFNFQRLSIDAAAYFSKSPEQVWAINAWMVFLHGDPPFQELAFIGGPKKMRGYFEGRLRDKHLWMLQAEYRFLVTGRFGATVFTGAGTVAPDLASLFTRQVHFTFGAGARYRLSKKDPINLRLDLGVNGQGEFFPYLTVREAF